MTKSIRPIPWDSRTFGIDCFEIESISEQSLAYASKNPGHYTVKLDPLADKSTLDRYGFYYVDTLIEPVCNKEHLICYQNPDCSVSIGAKLDLLLPMCTNSFLHGRFHRDFNLPSDAADRRYTQWLEQLQQEGEVFSLYYQHKLAGFIACQQGELLLHAIQKEFQGKGLAKYFWSEVCKKLFQNGIETVSSSISATNLPALNLYTSLGFHFHSPKDIYHLLVRRKKTSSVQRDN